MQWLWYFSELPLLATAVVLALYKSEVPVESKEDLRAVLMQAREFLVQIDWFEDQTPRDHQALMMLNYLLGSKRVSEEAKKIIAHIRTGVHSQVGDPADDMTRFMWGESLDSANALL